MNSYRCYFKWSNRNLCVFQVDNAASPASAIAGVKEHCGRELVVLAVVK